MALKMALVPFWAFPLISAFTWHVAGHVHQVGGSGPVRQHHTQPDEDGSERLTVASPHYASMSPNQRIAYISGMKPAQIRKSVADKGIADIGAQGLKPLFIAGCCVTTIFLDLSFASERWLRHTGLLARNVNTLEKVLSGLAIAFAVAGTAGLILLSIFDTLHHPHLHDGFLLLFIAGYLISAIFICAEYQRLGIHFRQHRILRISFWIKLIFIVVEIILAIAFGVCTFRSKQEQGAVLEWIIALIFTFYVLSFFIDLLPAVRTKHHSAVKGAPELEMGRGPTGTSHSMNDGVPLNQTDGAASETYYGDGGRYQNGTAAHVPVTKPITAQNF
ncbi:hypothetical protein MMC20_002911 [Loxospora ochrophaea]|nr:hypothetical protein [Loxospora ochrophaea]